MALDPMTLPARFGGLPHRSRPARSRMAVVASVALFAPMIANPAIPQARATPAVSYTYDASGRLASVTTAAGTATYHYDAEGNVLSITSPAAGPAGQAVAGRPAATVPAITSAGPLVTAPGRTITIDGHGFSATASKDLVHIGTLFARVTRASTTTLQLTAPPGTGGAVRITTPHGTALGPRVAISEPPTTSPPMPGHDPHPWRAAAGITALSGLVQDNHGVSLAGVRISILSLTGRPQARSVTGTDGRFLLARLSPGRHQLVIDGDSGHRHYGVYAEPVELPPGQTTVLPWITYLTRLDLAHAVTLSSPTAHQVTLTTPKIPGLKIEIPKGTVIRDHNGNVVTKVSVTSLASGRTPYPLAPGMGPEFFTIQPGDAAVSGPGLRVIYPNITRQPPGTAIPFLIDSPDWPGMGWWRYGTGHVSPSGKQIVPDTGVRWHGISLGGVPVSPPPGNGPRPGSCGGGGGGGGGGDGGAGGPPGGPGGCGGDPVDLGTGLFTSQTTDLTLRDVQGVALTRTFRQLDDTVRDFGIGMSSGLNFYIAADNSGNFDLYLPDGGKIAYTPTGTTGLYQSAGTPTPFAGSTLNWSGNDPFGPFTIRLANGTVLSFGDPAYLTQLSDRFGNTVDINRDPNGSGQIRTIVTPNGRWLKFTYATCVAPFTVCVTQVQDNSGRTLSYTYDPNGRLTTVTDPAGGTIRYGWAACTNKITCTEVLTVTDPNGNVTTNAYDSSGRISGQTDGAGGTWAYAYQVNGSGQITATTVTDPRGIQDTYTFDANSYLASVTDAAGTSQAQTTTTVFDPVTNLLTSQTDPLGRTTTYSYDGLGNITSLTMLAGTAHPSTYSFTYEPAYGRLTSITDPLGHVTTIAYDDTAHTETLTDALGHQWVITLNYEGQAVSITTPAGATTYLSYLYGDLVADTNPLDQATSAYYDAIGQPLQITDPLGNTANFTWTPLGELATQTSPLGAATAFGYDPDGNMTKVTDANGHATTFTYNGDNQVVKTADPLGNASIYAYDPDQNVSSVTDANGNTDTFAYDNLNRLTTAKYGVSGTSAQSKISYSYDAGGQLTKAVQTPGGTYAFSYDGLGDVLTQSTPQGTISRTYNAAGMTTTMSVPGQTQIAYTYDNDTHLTKITQGTTKVTLGYDTSLRLTSVSLPDSIKRTTTYDAASDPTALTFKHGTTTVGTVNYAYTPDGQISSESGTLAGASLPAAVTSNAYNADNELTTSGGTSYSYDHNGNLTSGGPNTYTWDARNQLTAISGGTTAAFSYNPFGQRATATLGGATTSYLYDGTKWNSNVVQELSGTTPTANLLTGAPGQIFQLTTPSGTSSSLLTGPLGSTIALASTAAAITTSYTYDSNGAVTTTGATSPNTFEFNATQNDGTGLYLMGARYYNPAGGTFIHQDPLGFGGNTTDLYSYAQNDPVNHSDPTGCGGCGGGGSGSSGNATAVATAVAEAGGGLVLAEKAATRVFGSLPNLAPLLGEDVGLVFGAGTGAEIASAGFGVGWAFLGGLALGTAINEGLTWLLGESLGDWVYDKLHPEDKMPAPGAACP